MLCMMVIFGMIGTIKLGDLGLVVDVKAPSDETGAPDHASLVHGDSLDESLSHGVGTALYRAPEQTEKGSR